MKTKHLFTVIIALLLIFVLVVGVMPNFIESKSIYDSYSYKSQILSKNSITQVYVEIDEDDFQSMLDNPTDEEEKEANVVINGYRVDNVSIRTKGNSSLTSVASDSTSDRYSFKIDFEAYNDQNLLGLTKLNLNNCYTDPSYMREYISYCLLEELGLPTPAFAYTRVYINGDLWGLYLGIEQINSSYINSNFSVVDGDLYKPDGLSLKLSDGQTAEEYISENEEAFSLKTNKGTSKNTALESLVEVINNGGDLESIMDVDEVIRYFAANTALVNMDSYTGNMFHNYYLYEQDGVFSIVPWDYDLSMGVFSIGGMGGGDGGGRGGGQGGPNQTATQSEDTASTQTPETTNSEVESTDSSELSVGGNLPTGSIPDGMTPPSGMAPPRGGGGMPTEGTAPTQGNTSSTNVSSTDTSTPTESSSDTTTDGGAGKMTPPDGMENEDFQGGGDGKGGGMGSQTIKFDEDTINFPIDTPVSGYDLASYPLINAWIENSTYKETYHAYLKEIAEGFFSTSRIQKLVAETMNMIATDVANDPNAKSTVAEFQSEAQNIIDFCIQRGESISGQLDGSIASTQESTGAVTPMSGGGGGGGGGSGAPNMDDEEMQKMFQNFENGNTSTVEEDSSTTGESKTDSQDSAQASEEGVSSESGRGDFQAGGGMGGPPGAGGEGGGGGDMMKPGGNGEETTNYTSSNIAAYAVAGIALVIASILLFFTKKRGHQKSIS